MRQVRNQGIRLQNPLGSFPRTRLEAASLVRWPKQPQQSGLETSEIGRTMSRPESLRYMGGYELLRPLQPFRRLISDELSFIAVVRLEVAGFRNERGASACCQTPSSMDMLRAQEELRI